MTRQYIESSWRCPMCEKRRGCLRVVDGVERCDCGCLYKVGKNYFKEQSMNHKSKLKCLLNPLLRKLQFWTTKPFVIASICDLVGTKDGYYYFVFYGYVFRRMEYIKE